MPTQKKSWVGFCSHPVPPPQVGSAGAGNARAPGGVLTQGYRDVSQGRLNSSESRVECLPRETRLSSSCLQQLDFCAQRATVRDESDVKTGKSVVLANVYEDFSDYLRAETGVKQRIH